MATHEPNRPYPAERRDYDTAFNWWWVVAIVAIALVIWAVFAAFEAPEPAGPVNPAAPVVAPDDTDVLPGEPRTETPLDPAVGEPADITPDVNADTDARRTAEPQAADTVNE